MSGCKIIDKLFEWLDRDFCLNSLAKISGALLRIGQKDLAATMYYMVEVRRYPHQDHEKNYTIWSNVHSRSDHYYIHPDLFKHLCDGEKEDSSEEGRQYVSILDFVVDLSQAMDGRDRGIRKMQALSSLKAASHDIPVIMEI